MIDAVQVTGSIYFATLQRYDIFETELYVGATICNLRKSIVCLSTVMSERLEFFVMHEEMFTDERLIERANRYLSFEADFLTRSDAKSVSPHAPKMYSVFFC